METFLIKATQFVLAFAILVVIHEFGHFLFARLFGVRVEKFYIFFNPITSLFRWKPKSHVASLNKVKYTTPQGAQNGEKEKELEAASQRYYKASAALEKAKKSSGIFSKADSESPAYQEKIAELQRECKEAEAEYSRLYSSRMEDIDREYEIEKKESPIKRFWGHTEYGLGWLPLGGYCKISGMIDESLDTEQLKSQPKEWEFRSKPAWKRLLIMIAGVLFNFLLAILIYAGIVFATGEKYVPFKDASMGMAFSQEAKNIGFKDGDIPLKADDKLLDNPNEARLEIIQAKKVTVLRDGKEINIAIPDDFMIRLDKEMREGNEMISFMAYRIPAQISQVTKGEGAAKAGMEVGDRIIAIDSVMTPTLPDFLTALQGHENSTVNIKLIRNIKTSPDTIITPVKLSDTSKMGIGLELDPASFFNSKTINYNLFQSIPRGIEMGTDKLVSYAKSMKMVFTKEGAKSLGGFGTLGSIFPDKWDWIAFWNIAAFLSVALAFMNILPIPALDGGHVLFLIYEVIFRRPPSEKFMLYAQYVGMTILILLLLYANGMDIVRLFK